MSRTVPAAGPGALPTDTRTLLLPYAVAFAVAALALLMASAGYSGMDDQYYLEAADRWREHAPFIGLNHWHLRLPSVLSIAASFALFGRTEAAFMLPNLLCYAGLLVVSVRLVGGVAGPRAAAIAGALVAATPVFALYAKIPYPDVPETFLVALSLYWFWNGTTKARAAAFVLCGMALGISWLLRASCVPLALLYAVLFARAYRVPRRFYVFIAVGFLPLVLAETAFYAYTTSHPFYRLGVDARALDIPSAHLIGGSANGLRPPFNWELMSRWVPNSVVDVHWLINPYIDFLTSGSYGLIYLCGLVAGWQVCVRRAAPDPTRTLGRLLCAMALLWVFVVIYVINLRPQPRYFGPATWTCCIVTALWLSEVVWKRSAHIALVIAIVVLATDLLLVDLRSDPLRLQRELADYARRAGEPVWTDIEHAEFFLDEAGVASRVHAATPAQVPAGALCVVDGAEAAKLAATGWPVVWRSGPLQSASPPTRTLVHLVLPSNVQARWRAGAPELVALRRPVNGAADAASSGR